MISLSACNTKLPDNSSRTKITPRCLNHNSRIDIYLKDLCSYRTLFCITLPVARAGGLAVRHAKVTESTNHTPPSPDFFCQQGGMELKGADKGSNLSRLPPKGVIQAHSATIAPRLRSITRGYWELAPLRLLLSMVIEIWYTFRYVCNKFVVCWRQ